MSDKLKAWGDFLALLSIPVAIIAAVLLAFEFFGNSNETTRTKIDNSHPEPSVSNTINAGSTPCSNPNESTGDNLFKAILQFGAPISIGVFIGIILSFIYAYQYTTQHLQEFLVSGLIIGIMNGCNTFFRSNNDTPIGNLSLEKTLLGTSVFFTVGISYMGYGFLTGRNTDWHVLVILSIWGGVLGLTWHFILFREAPGRFGSSVSCLWGGIAGYILSFLLNSLVQSNPNKDPLSGLLDSRLLTSSIEIIIICAFTQGLFEIIEKMKSTKICGYIGTFLTIGAILLTSFGPLFDRFESK